MLGTKTVRAGVRIGARGSLVGEDEEVQVRLEFADGSSWDGRRTELLGAQIEQIVVDAKLLGISLEGSVG